MNHLKSIGATCKQGIRRFGAAIAGFFALVAGCLVLSAFATLGLAVLGVGAVAMTTAVLIGRMSPNADREAVSA
ncbi:hypothetical protein [Roseibium sp. MMSF_3544]|uniref:hypothetical protein n=1 Tax=unclassified Roseibium TaxID=2629323 RepID=UPI00273EB94B|nr:hypothetical protein [Roseibium sp. MMSF_3544]